MGCSSLRGTGRSSREPPLPQLTLGEALVAGKSGGEGVQRSNGNNLGVFAKPLPAAK